MAHYTSIFKAIKYNNLESLYYFIHSGEINIIHPKHYTPLEYAVRLNKPQIVSIVLEAGARSYGILNIAVNTHDDDIIILKLLYDYGYRFTTEDRPLCVASMYGYFDKLKFLLEHFELSIDQTTKYLEGRTPLYYGVVYHYENIIYWVLEQGADPHIVVTYDVIKQLSLPIIEYALIYHPRMHDIIANYCEVPIKEPV
jgi:ankyrin repeat protein